MPYSSFGNLPLIANKESPETKYPGGLSECAFISMAGQWGPPKADKDFIGFIFA
jgi:hypothetical protein